MSNVLQDNPKLSATLRKAMKPEDPPEEEEEEEEKGREAPSESTLESNTSSGREDQQVLEDRRSQTPDDRISLPDKDVKE